MVRVYMAYITWAHIILVLGFRDIDPILAGLGRGKAHKGCHGMLAGHTSKGPQYYYRYYSYYSYHCYSCYYY